MRADRYQVVVSTHLPLHLMPCCVLRDGSLRGALSTTPGGPCWPAESLGRAPAGTHRLGALGCCCQAALDYLGGDAVARVARVGAAREDGSDDLAGPVDDGAARVAWPDVDAEARYGALHGAAVVGVAGDHVPRRAGAG